jgi:hypothetical protein
MESNFFRTRPLFWSFWSNLVFFLGMIGYLLIDGYDYMRPNTLSSSLSSSIYVFLAAVFIVDSSLQIVSIYKTSSSTPRYYIMVFSCIFDEVGSQAYFLGALFTAIAFTSSQTVWTFNTVGVCGFVIGATMNMLVHGSSIFYFWANLFNLLGSLLYLSATMITLVPLTQIIVIAGDFVYLIDAILYIICWFSDRQLSTLQGEQTALVHK